MGCRGVVVAFVGLAAYLGQGLVPQQQTSGGRPSLRVLLRASVTRFLSSIGA